MAMRRGITKQAIQKTVDQLAKRELVIKVIPENDRRNRIISLTVQGQSLLHDIYKVEVAELAKLTSLVDDDDILAVNRLLDVIETSMNRCSSELLERAE